MAALAGALLVATRLAAGCSAGPTPRGELDLDDMPGMAKNDFGRNSPQFHSADAACRNLLPPGITDDGSGP